MLCKGAKARGKKKAAAFIMLGRHQPARLIILKLSRSFVGAGVPADMPSWGTMIADGRDSIRARWLMTFPGPAFSLSVLSINFVGDAPRTVLDPRLGL
jgi:peptide/nickel transport system permease protein